MDRKSEPTATKKLLDGVPSADAIQLADALKRMLAADDGRLAERLDGFIRYPFLTADSAMFSAIFGTSLNRVMEELGIEPPSPPEPARLPGVSRLPEPPDAA